MNYTVIHGGQQYGPYTLADLQRYLASGEISGTDLAFGTGISKPVPVSQIVKRTLLQRLLQWQRR